MYLIQIIALLVYAIVMISALIDFKKTVLVWVPISLLFNPRVCVLYQPPVTALTVAVDLSLVMMFFFIKEKNSLWIQPMVVHLEKLYGGCQCS